MMTARARGLLFGAYCLGVGLLNLDALRALFALSMTDDSASHLVLVPLVTVALVFHNRASIYASVRSDWSAGLPVIAGGAGLLLFGGWLNASGQGDWLSVTVLALAVLWVGGFLLLYGRQAVRAARFPLLFLAFMIPIPKGVLDAAVLVLKSGSTEVVDVLFALTGTPHHREGFIFWLPRVTIEVADECSGIRSSIALVITTVLAGHVFLTSPWTKAMLVLVVLPVTLLKNGIRIVGLSLLASHVDPAFLAGQLHRDGGVMFFLLALAILAPVLTLLRRSEPRLG